ncbi:carbohydrate esterase family 3 protein [Xylaria sp. FL1777]|nr:carbohydrate esterase family 3 protein [Xylaria sp. FL1777]
MSTFKRDDWRGFINVIHGRRAIISFAVLLITISFLTYYSYNTNQIDKPSYHGGSIVNPPGNGTAGSKQPQNPSSSDNHSSSKTPTNPDALDDILDELRATESSFNSSTIASTKNASTVSTSPAPLGSGIPLRVMFLGASVTRGDVSIGKLGFRSPLRDRLAALGNPVNFVGSQRVGAFIDNDLEAYPGNRIDQIHDHSTRIVSSTKPNVFVLHVGSNDCLQKHDTENAGKRMRDLINYLFNTSPRATIIMSTLLTNTVPDKEPCILDLNIQIRKLASALEREGRPVVLAEMHCEQGLPYRPVPADISPDGTHPFDGGYALMADIFFSAFLEADSRGFLKSPEQNGVPDDGELERADEPFIFESEPPKKAPTPPKDGSVKDNIKAGTSKHESDKDGSAVKNMNVPPKRAHERMAKAT